MDGVWGNPEALQDIENAINDMIKDRGLKATISELSDEFLVHVGNDDDVKQLKYKKVSFSDFETGMFISFICTIVVLSRGIQNDGD